MKGESKYYSGARITYGLAVQGDTSSKEYTIGVAGVKGRTPDQYTRCPDFAPPNRKYYPPSKSTTAVREGSLPKDDPDAEGEDGRRDKVVGTLACAAAARAHGACLLLPTTDHTIRFRTDDSAWPPWRRSYWPCCSSVAEGRARTLLIYSPLQDKKQATEALQKEVDDLETKLRGMQKAAPRWPRSAGQPPAGLPSRPRDPTRRRRTTSPC